MLRSGLRLNRSLQSLRGCGMTVGPLSSVHRQLSTAGHTHSRRAEQDDHRGSAKPDWRQRGGGRQGGSRGHQGRSDVRGGGRKVAKKAASHPLACGVPSRAITVALERNGIDSALTLYHREPTEADAGLLAQRCGMQKVKGGADICLSVFHALVEANVDGAALERVATVSARSLTSLRAYSHAATLWEVVEEKKLTPGPTFMGLMTSVYAKVPTAIAMDAFLPALRLAFAADGSDSQGAGRQKPEGMESWSSVWVPNVVDLTKLALGVTETGDREVAEELTALVMGSYKVKVDARLTQTLTRMLAGCGAIDQAVALVEEQAGQGVPASAFAFTALASGCAVGADAERAEQVHRWINERPEQEEARKMPVCNALMDMYNKCQLPMKALDVLDVYLSDYGATPSVVTFTTALRSCALAHSVSDAERIRSLLDTYDAWCDKTYTSLITTYSACVVGAAAITEPLSLLRLLVDGKGKGGAKATEGAFSAVLGACGRTKRIDDALEVQHIYEQSGVQLTQRLANAFLSAFAVPGGERDFMRFWRELRSSEVAFSSEMYTTCLGACSSLDLGSGSEDILRELAEDMASGAVVADQVLYNALIRYYTDTEEYGRAEEVYREAKEGQQELTEEVILSLLRMAGKWRQLWFINELKQLVDGHGSLWASSSLCAGLIALYSQAGQLPIAHDIFQAAVVQQRATMECWTAILSACAGQGDADTAILYFKQLVMSEQRPTSSAVYHVLDALCGGNRVEQAIALLSSMDKEFRAVPEDRHLLLVVRALYARNRKEEARGILEAWPHKVERSVWAEMQSLLD